MRKGTMFKVTALGILAAAVVALFAWGSGAPRAAVAGGPPSLPPLISCPNVDGGDDNRVLINDVSAVIQRYRQDYPALTYAYLYDSVDPYNYQSPSGTGQIRIGDVSYVIQHYRQTCSALETQIAKATRAISDPTFSDKLCDDADPPLYTDPVPCGGSAQFLTEPPAYPTPGWDFLLGKGYRTTGIDVPGQGVHYVNGSLWDGVFNPVRPEGLVYNDGVLQAQLYYGEGDVIGWGSDRDNNKGAVNTDALPCAADLLAPPAIGCGWAGTNDGWHWHKNLCTTGIGTNPSITIMPSQQACSDWGAARSITCTFPPTPNFTCNWQAAVGWMGHLWNWLPNANYTNAVNPGPGGLNECAASLCATTESNGRFADCFRDVQGWNAYNCPQ